MVSCIAGFFTSEFDSTYPISLNDIISQYDFEESIKKINPAFSYGKSWTVVITVIFVIGIFIGTTSFIVGGVLASKS